MSNTTHKLNTDEFKSSYNDNDTNLTVDHGIGITALAHLTIKQIMSAPEPEYINQEKVLKINNKIVTQVMICGTIIHIDHKQTFTDITLSDGTASIKVKFWTSNEDPLQNELLKLKFCS